MFYFQRPLSCFSQTLRILRETNVYFLGGVTTTFPTLRSALGAGLLEENLQKEQIERKKEKGWDWTFWQILGTLSLTPPPHYSNSQLYFSSPTHKESSEQEKKNTYHTVRKSHEIERNANNVEIFVKLLY